MRRLPLLLAVAPILSSATAPADPPAPTVEQQLREARAETEQAERRIALLQQREQRANDAAARLKIERQQAAADIALAEARITSADVALAAARAQIAVREERLAQRRAPLAALLAGLATMGRRPPILTLADGASIREVVRVRALVDSSMPIIARRSAALQAELGAGRRLAERAILARQEVVARRSDLAASQARFAALEHRALAAAGTARRDAFGEEDSVIAGGEDLLDLQSEAAAAAQARTQARALAAFPLAPPRPVAPLDAPVRPAIDYRLPTTAAVSEGFGSVNRAGVRARGIRFATPRGASIAAPADGTVLFAGPFRDHDGIVVIDHGHGWTSLIIDVSPSVERGARVAAGAPLGRALGPVSLELRERGVPRSAALIAGSSGLLSNSGKTR